MPKIDPNQWLTVGETATKLGTSAEMVRRKIRAGELPASRLTTGARAPWMVNAAALDRQLEGDAARQRVTDAGIVTGRGDFLERLDASEHPPDAKQAVREIHDRHNLFDRVETEMYADEEIRRRFAQLDEDERIEQAARELARRIREQERIRERALEILDDED